MIINCRGGLIKKKVYHGLEFSYRFPSVESYSFLIFIQHLLKFLGTRKENNLLTMNLPASSVTLLQPTFALDSLRCCGHPLPSPVALLLPPQVDCYLIFGVSFSIHLFILLHMYMYLPRALFLPFKVIFYICVPLQIAFSLSIKFLQSVGVWIHSLIFNC